MAGLARVRLAVTDNTVRIYRLLYCSTSIHSDSTQLSLLRNMIVYTTHCLVKCEMRKKIDLRTDYGPISPIFFNDLESAYHTVPVTHVSKDRVYQ
jgi:hypothetical protein